LWTGVIPRIFAMGGGGFLMEPDNPRLDRFVLSLAPSARPRVCFLPTASGDAQPKIELFEATFAALGAEPSTLSLFKPPTADLRALVLSQHVVYVGGGNTRSMLALWREWGLDTILREAWQSGVVLAGLSAGSICWFEHGVTDSIPGALTPISCLGFLRGSNCPHYDGEAERRPAFRRLVATRAVGPGLAADDGVGLLFEGPTLTDVVSSRARASCRSRRDCSARRLAHEDTSRGTAPPAIRPLFIERRVGHAPRMRTALLISLFLFVLLPSPLATAQPRNQGVGGSGMGQGEASVTSRADVTMSVESGPATSSEKLGQIAGNLSGALNDIRQCYTRIAGRRPIAEGAMRVRISLPAGSRAADVEITLDRVTDRELSQCVTRIVRAPSFRDVQRPASAFLALEFSNTATAGTRVVAARQEDIAQGAVTVGPDGVARATGRTPSGEVQFTITGAAGTTREALVSVGRALNARLGSLLDCRRHAGRRGANPAGQIAAAWRIAGGRRTTTPGASTVADPNAARCVATLLTRGVLPDLPRAGVFQVSITFAGQEAQGAVPPAPPAPPAATSGAPSGRPR